MRMYHNARPSERQMQQTVLSLHPFCATQMGHAIWRRCARVFLGCLHSAILLISNISFYIYIYIYIYIHTHTHTHTRTYTHIYIYSSKFNRSKF